MPLLPFSNPPGSNSGAVSSVSNSDGTLTISPTTGSVVASIATSAALPGSPTTTTQSAGDNTTKIATDAFVTTAVANAIAGVNQAVAVQAATTSSADTSGLTYNNGASGIGATFTGTTNTAIVIDGYTFTAVGQRLLVKNDTQSPSGAFNGVYYVTQVQTSLLPPILTRALDYDQPSDINNTGAIPVINGTVNALSSWIETAIIVTVGTTPLTFTHFSYSPTSVVPPSLGGTGVANSKNLTVRNALTLAGTDSTTMTFPSTSASIARTDSAQTFTGTQTFGQVTANLVLNANNAVSVSSNAGTCSVSYRLNTFTNSSAATMAITIATAGATDGQLMIVRVYDFSGVAETIGWTNTENSTVSAPTTSNGSTTLPLTVGFQYNGSTSKWRCIASA